MSMSMSTLLTKLLHSGNTTASAHLEDILSTSFNGCCFNY